MRHRMGDGSALDDEQWHTNIEALLEQWKPHSRPDFVPGLRLPVDDGVDRVLLCAGPYFALERRRVRGDAALAWSFGTAQIVTNAGAPCRFTCGDREWQLGRAETVLLPAALGQARLHGPADVLVGYLPDLEDDIHRPLTDAGYDPVAISALGEGLS